MIKFYFLSRNFFCIYVYYGTYIYDIVIKLNQNNF